MELYVARQPIFDTHVNVVAYELLYRSGTVNAFDGSEENTATAKVISASFYSPGGRDIMDGKPVFINFPRTLLVSGGGAILPPEEVVVEILETVTSDPEVIAACSALRSQGYRMALDDFIPDPGPQPLTEFAGYLKVDFRATDSAQQLEAVRRYGKTTCMLAEKVETPEEFRRAKAMGYSLFQGYFFARPVIVSTRDIPGFKLNRLRILQQLQLADMDFAAMGELIHYETCLSYKLLRFVNSALFTVRKPIESITQAMVYIGEMGMRRWLPVIILTDMSSDLPGQLPVNALIRARWCELLAPEAGLGHRRGDLFLLGLFSHLDAMYGRPMEELLPGLNLNGDLAETLLGQRPYGDRMAALWDAVIAYEQGRWDRMAEFCALGRIHTGSIATLYASAVKWADAVIHGRPEAEPETPAPQSERDALLV
jgi:EAL and modified HD-GYP domain-containing signal transduction protein